MRLKELRIGSLVKYKDRICTVENINGSDEMLYLHYNKNYYCGANVKDIEPLEIDELTLEDSGFDRVIPGQWRLDTKDFIYYIKLYNNDNLYNWGLVVYDKSYESNTCEVLLRYWHQLQLITGMYED